MLQLSKDNRLDEREIMSDRLGESVSEKDITLRSVHLDAARGIAALIVVVGHERGLFFSSFTTQDAPRGSIHENAGIVVRTNVTESAITIGHEAVMVFFVLSGFLVGGSVLKSIRNKRWSWGNYLVRRLTRLWVVLVPALLMGCTFDLYGSYIFSGTASIYSAPAGQPYVTTPEISSLYSPAILFGNIGFLQDIVVPTAGSNVALWSLSNEFWYYITFPMLLLAINNESPTWRRAIFFLIGTAVLFSVGIHTSYLFIVWMLGAVTSIMPLKCSQSVARWGALLLTVILAFAFFEVKNKITNVYAGEAVIASIFAVLLYLVLHEKGKVTHGVYHFVATHTSRMSYTLYLVHLPILVFICAWINTPWHLWMITPLNITMTLLVLIVTLASAYLIYFLFEANTDRVRRWITRKRA